MEKAWKRAERTAKGCTFAALTMVGATTVAGAQDATSRSNGSLAVPTSSVVSTTAPDAVERLGFREVVARAYVAYPELRIVAAEQDAADALRSLAWRTRFLPTLKSTNVFGVVPAARGSIFDSPDTPRDLNDLGPFMRVKVEATLPLYDFGGLRAGQRAAETLVQSKREKARGKRLRAAGLSAEAYFGFLLAAEMLAILEEVQGRLERLNDKLQNPAEDMAPAEPLDLLRIRGYGLELESLQAEAEKQREIAADGLRELVGNPLGRPVRPEADKLRALEQELTTVEEAVDEGLRNRPELAELELAARARQLKADMVSRKFLPEMALQGQFDYGVAGNREPQDNPFVYEPFNTQSISVVLGMRWDLSVPQLAARVRGERAEVTQLRETRAAVEALARHEIVEFHARLAASLKRHLTSRRALSTAANWFRLAEESYDLGNASLKDVIESYGNFIKLRSGHLEAVHELDLAIIDWRLALGRSPLREGESP